MGLLIIIIRSLGLIGFIFLSIFGASFIFLIKSSKILSMGGGLVIFYIGALITGFASQPHKVFFLLLIAIIGILWFNLEILEKSNLREILKKK